MYNIEYSFENGIINISEIFEIEQAPVFNNINDEYIINFGLLENISKLISFTYDTTGMSDGRYLLPFFRVSKDNINWYEWIDLKKDIDNYPDLDPLDHLYLEIKWIRNGFSENGLIYLLEYNINGLLDRQEEYLDSLIIINSNSEKIVSSPFIFKVFSILDYEIITYPENSNLDIEYRYSQDSTRTWSRWEILNKENIRTIKINKTRFFQIEYLVKNNTTESIKIYDINLIGNFQNISKDYNKSNLFGIREFCSSNILGGSIDENGNFVANTNFNSTSLAPSCDSNIFNELNSQEKANLYNPYAQNTAINLWEKLSNDSLNLFGHKVTYFLTDPDRKGEDKILNEYQLYNIVSQEDIKVTVTDNKFPDSQIKMNMFDLDLFETMEIQITKQEFKRAFGKQRRPSKEDFMFFCNLNRMFQVDHSQQERSFNNSAVFYKIILKKYTQKSNVKSDNIDIKNQLDQLTKNSTIDELFGVDIEEQKQAIANKDQLKPLTRETTRLEYLAEIDKELIENSTTIISKSHYDLSSVQYRKPAILYKNFNSLLKKSDNLSFVTWFNINNYINSEIYNFISNYDNQNNLGWALSLQDDIINFKINSDEYNFELNSGNSNDALLEETWYCILINIDQRNRKLQTFIYKRNVEEEEEAQRLPNNILKKIYYKQENINSYEFDIHNELQILASDMRITNIRLFSDIIPEDVHNKILNQYIIGDDSKYLIMADNATEKLFLPRFPLFE